MEIIITTSIIKPRVYTHIVMYAKGRGSVRERRYGMGKKNNNNNNTNNNGGGSDDDNDDNNNNKVVVDITRTYIYNTP